MICFDLLLLPTVAVMVVACVAVVLLLLFALLLLLLVLLGDARRKKYALRVLPAVTRLTVYRGLRVCQTLEKTQTVIQKMKNLTKK